MKLLQKIGTSLVCLALASAPTQAQDTAPGEPPRDAEADSVYYGLEAADPFDLNELICWDIITLNDDDRAFAMVLLFGFAQGQKNDANVSPRDVQVAVVNTIHACVDSPDSKVIDLLKKYVEIK